MTISGPDDHASLIAAVDALLQAASEMGLPSRYQTVVLRLPMASSRSVCMCILNLSRS